jgi:hypothetical protein
MLDSHLVRNRRSRSHCVIHTIDAFIGASQALRLEAALCFSSTACSTRPETSPTPILGSAAVGNMAVIRCFWRSDLAFKCGLMTFIDGIWLPFKKGLSQTSQKRKERDADAAWSDWKGRNTECMCVTRRVSLFRNLIILFLFFFPFSFSSSRRLN